MRALYDEIGVGYANFREPDHRIDEAIRYGLGDAQAIVNVGAGAGSYEPADRFVVAVEPSMTMLKQRFSAAGPAIQATAAALPFKANVFDAALAILTIHHWPDRAAGLNELRRVSRSRVVILTWDPSSPGFWLTDYFPEILDMDRPIFPSLDELERELGPTLVVNVPIPHDCTDGFLGAYWRRPGAYLDERVRSAISTFSKLQNPTPGLTKLRDDLDSGRWRERYGEILNEYALDLGYRLIVAAD